MQRNYVAKKVEEMAPSGIRAFFDLVLGMKDVISLGVGEPDFVTPWHIRESGIASLEAGYTSYTSNKGLMKLRLLISQMLKKRFRLTYCPNEEILITVGVSEGVDLAMRAIINPGDQVLVPMPSYVSYGPMVELAGGTAVLLRTDANCGFKITPQEIERVCTKKTKAIMLNYPANPTGVSYSRDELEKINRVCRKHQLLVISDEIYADLTYEGRHCAFPALPGARDMTLYLNGFSKAYAMTGWRIGYACGPQEIIGAMTKIHQYTILCAPIIGQWAACEALQRGDGDVETMRAEYRRRRDFVINRLAEIGLPCVKPDGAFYVFPSIEKTGMASLDFAAKLLQEKKIALVPGSAFGKQFDGHVRMSYAAKFEQLKEAMQRLGDFIKERG
ncbi:MAG: aminotransferase class I/II-fold pyridoxal phosphate-dependent enzyme [Candidatus Omnitrophica bacterium]|nr:aminotransferase class I/II-fold pyridoxal phosphate-dependent enzyme [Candidatus Omnitrophota bacterium]